MDDAKTQIVNQLKNKEISDSPQYTTEKIRERINTFFNLLEKQETEEHKKKQLETRKEELETEIQKEKDDFIATDEKYQFFQKSILDFDEEIQQLKLDSLEPSCENTKIVDNIKQLSQNILNFQNKQKMLLDKLHKESLLVKEKNKIDKKILDLKLTPEEQIELQNNETFFANIYTGDDVDMKNRCTGTIFNCFSKKYKAAKMFIDQEFGKINKMKILLEELFMNFSDDHKSLEYIIKDLKRRLNTGDLEIKRIDLKTFNQGNIKYFQNLDLQSYDKSNEIDKKYYKYASKKNFASMTSQRLKELFKDKGTDTGTTQANTGIEKLKNLSYKGWLGIGSKINSIYDKKLSSIENIPPEVLKQLDKEKQEELYKKNPNKYSFFSDEIKAVKKIDDDDTIEDIKKALTNNKKEIGEDDILTIYKKYEKTVDEDEKFELEKLLSTKLTERNLEKIFSDEPESDDLTPSDDTLTIEFQKGGNNDDLKKLIVDIIFRFKKFHLLSKVCNSKFISDIIIQKLKDIKYEDLLLLKTNTTGCGDIQKEINDKLSEIKETSDLPETVTDLLLNTYLFNKFKTESKNFTYSQGGGGENSDESKTLSVTSNFDAEKIQKWIENLEDEQEIIKDLNSITLDIVVNADALIQSTDSLESIKKELKKYNSSKNLKIKKNLENITNNLKSSLRLLVKNGIIKEGVKGDISTAIQKIRDFTSYVEDYDNNVKQLNKYLSDLHSKLENYDRVFKSTKGNEKNKPVYINEINNIIDKSNSIITSYFGKNKGISTATGAAPAANGTTAPTAAPGAVPPAAASPADAAEGTRNSSGSILDKDDTFSKLKMEAIGSIDTIIKELKDVIKKKGKNLGNKENNIDRKYSEVWDQYVKDLNDDDVSNEKSRDKFYKSFKVNNLDPGKALVITNDNKIIFIITIFIFRQISLAITEKLIESGYITTFFYSLVFYSFTYIFLILLTVIIVNIDEYKIRIIFNHFNLHNGFFKIHYHLIIKIFLIIMLYSLANRMNPSMNENKDRLSELDKMHLVYKLEVLTISVFCLISIVEFF